MDSKEEEEEEKPLMIKRRKQMRRTILNLEVLASHTIPWPQQPYEEAQRPTRIIEIPNPKQVAKQEPHSEGQVAQHVPTPGNQDVPQEHQRQRSISLKRNLAKWFPSRLSSPQHHQ